jgi:hypothetical protein
MPDNFLYQPRNSKKRFLTLFILLKQCLAQENDEFLILQRGKLYYFFLPVKKVYKVICVYAIKTKQKGGCKSKNE